MGTEMSEIWLSFFLNRCSAIPILDTAGVSHPMVNPSVALLYRTKLLYVQVLWGGI